MMRAPINEQQPFSFDDQSTKPFLSNVATYIFTKYMRGQYAILLLQYHRWGIKVDIRYHNYIIQCGSILDI